VEVAAVAQGGQVGLVGGHGGVGRALFGHDKSSRGHVKVPNTGLEGDHTVPLVTFKNVDHVIQ
jgi:hypothetical protein